MFVNRSTELGELHRWWSSPHPRPAIVWGRRRVGKTALLGEFAKDLPAVFHTGTGQAVAGELADLSRKVAAAHPRALRDLAERPYRDWQEALDDLASLAAESPLLVVLDEFPELVRGCPELPSVIRAFLDRVHGHTELRLLLCGSAVQYMESALEYRAPLYGRFDLTLQLHPFSPSESARMLPDLTPPVRAAVHGLLGGVPLYLSWWDQSASFEENIHRLVCRPGGILLSEGQLILATEGESGDLPAAVLHAIAAGRTKHNEIKDWVGADPTRTLDRLINMRLVERLRPVTETEMSRRRLYRIADNLLAFYLSVLNQHLPEIERGLGERILPTIMNSLDDHLGARWEAALRDHLRKMAVDGELGEDVVAVGPFWTAQGGNEIDALVLAGRARTPVLAAEAKWAKEVSAARIVRRLERKLEAAADDPNSVEIAVCARERVHDLPPGVRAITAEDIYAT